jgi:hypothetical protein
VRSSSSTEAAGKANRQTEVEVQIVWLRDVQARTRTKSVALIALFLILGGLISAVTAAAHGGKNGEKAHPAAVKLFGHIDELSYMCSSAGVKLSGSGLPSTVSKLSLGSAAAYSGLKTGDKVLHAEMDDNILNLTVDRRGKKYQAKIATDVYGLRTEFENRKIPFSFGDSAFDKDLKTLGNCEIVVMLDRCASMNDTHAGVPGDLSKWIWCKEQIDNLYLATDRVLERVSTMNRSMTNLRNGMPSLCGI